jgi:hypothetical protein
MKDITAYFYLSDGRLTVDTDDNRFRAHFADKTIDFVDLFSDLVMLLESIGYECRVIDQIIEG